MNPRLILFGSENRQRLLAGVQTFAKTVCITYGPHGRIVLLDRAAGLLATKDGVTVAREVDLKDPVANMACQAFKQACITVNDEAGDGTTSTACIASAILEEGIKLVEGGHNPIHMARGIKMAADHAVNAVYDLAQPITTQEQLEKVALIASNDDAEIAAHMAEAVMAVGKNGTVSIEDGNGVETVLIFKDGMEIDRGAASMAFLKDNTERVLDGPLVAVIAGTLSKVEDVLDLCEEATTFGGRPLVVFCEGINGEALKTMVLNDSQSDFEFVAIPSPGNFEWKVKHLGDIAALAGADLIDPRAGGQWQKWDREWFGALRTLKVEAKKSTLVSYDEAYEVIRSRIDQIKAERQHATSQYDIDRVNERIAQLDGGLCIMQIGAHTEAELKEKRARVEDALGAVQGALEDGFVPGAGLSYLWAYESIKGLCPSDEPDVRAGWLCMEAALRRPLEKLTSNAGLNGAYMVDKLLDKRAETQQEWLGWDGRSGELRDFSEDHAVIDPTRVAVAVIDAASSAAATLMTSEASVSEMK